MIDLNTKIVVSLCPTSAIQMAKRGAGAFLNVGSQRGDLSPGPLQGAFTSTTKSFVQSSLRR